MQTPGWSRRDVLRGGAGLGLAIAGAALATGCGGDGGSSAAQGSGKPRAAGLPRGVRTTGPASGPGVLLLHAWWGVTPGVMTWAKQLGDAGAHVVVPDLYGGSLPDDAEEAQTLADGLDDGAVHDTLDACARVLSRQGDWSALGWSLGAFHASQMMSREHAPSRAVLFYGGTPLDGSTTTTQVQLHLVADDQYFTADEIAATVRSLEAADVSVQRFDYPGLHHWFAEPGSPAYDAAGAAQARTRATTFLGL
jgi:carboxymethylenebutenolidase